MSETVCSPSRTQTPTKPTARAVGFSASRVPTHAHANPAALRARIERPDSAPLQKAEQARCCTCRHPDGLEHANPASLGSLMQSSVKKSGG